MSERAPAVWFLHMMFCCRFPELDNLFYALIVFDREQFFEKYEDGRSLGVSVVTIGTILVGLCVQQVIASALVHDFDSSVYVPQIMQRRDLVPYSSEDLDREVLKAPSKKCSVLISCCNRSSRTSSI